MEPEVSLPSSQGLAIKAADPVLPNLSRPAIRDYPHI
jgi:hypothetical protein